MTNPTGAAPLCARCNQHRDANIHLTQNAGHTWYHPYQPLPAKATTLQVVATDLFAALEEVYHSNLIDGDRALCARVYAALVQARQMGLLSQ